MTIQKNKRKTPAEARNPPIKLSKKENPEQRLESKQQAKVIKLFGKIKHGEKHE